MRYQEVIGNPVGLTEAPSATIEKQSTYKAKASALDYDGIDFDKFAIKLDGRRIGEIDVQRGKKTATVRNIILYSDAMTGKGIGKAVYGQLKALYKGKALRSSFSVNRSGDQQTTGLSDQAIAMWDSMVAKGLASRVEDGDRFYYQMA